MRTVARPNSPAASVDSVITPYCIDRLEARMVEAKTAMKKQLGYMGIYQKRCLNNLRRTWQKLRPKMSLQAIVIPLLPQ